MADGWAVYAAMPHGEASAILWAHRVADPAHRAARGRAHCVTNPHWLSGGSLAQTTCQPRAAHARWAAPGRPL